MAFENDTNTGRVEKMIDILGLITKSATSNRASDDQVREMLKPLVAQLADIRAFDEDTDQDNETSVLDRLPDQQAPRKGAWGVSAPPWASVHDMAVSASLDDLEGAVIVYLQRCADDRAARSKS